MIRFDAIFRDTPPHAHFSSPWPYMHVITVVCALGISSKVDLTWLSFGARVRRRGQGTGISNGLEFRVLAESSLGGGISEECGSLHLGPKRPNVFPPHG